MTMTRGQQELHLLEVISDTVNCFALFTTTLNNFLSPAPGLEVMHSRAALCYEKDRGNIGNIAFLLCCQR